MLLEERLLALQLLRLVLLVQIRLKEPCLLARTAAAATIPGLEHPEFLRSTPLLEEGLEVQFQPLLRRLLGLLLELPMDRFKRAEMQQAGRREAREVQEQVWMRTFLVADLEVEVEALRLRAMLEPVEPVEAMVVVEEAEAQASTILAILEPEAMAVQPSLW